MFLETQGGSKACRRMCRMKKDSKASTWWILEVLSIRESTWDEIQWLLSVLSVLQTGEGR